MNFNGVRADIQSMQQSVMKERNSLFKKSIAKGEEKCLEWGIDVGQQRRVRRKKRDGWRGDER